MNFLTLEQMQKARVLRARGANDILGIRRQCQLLSQIWGLERREIRALNSAVECHLHTVEVAGSNPAAPTKSHENVVPWRWCPRATRTFNAATNTS